MWLFHEDYCHYDLLVPQEVVQLHHVTAVPTSLSQTIVQPVPAMLPETVQHLVQHINLTSAEEAPIESEKLLLLLIRTQVPQNR